MRLVMKPVAGPSTPLPKQCTASTGLMLIEHRWASRLPPSISRSILARCFMAMLARSPRLYGHWPRGQRGRADRDIVRAAGSQGPCLRCTRHCDQRQNAAGAAGRTRPPRSPRGERDFCITVLIARKVERSGRVRPRAVGLGYEFDLSIEVKQLIGILTAVKSSSYFTLDTLNQCPLLGVKRTLACVRKIDFL